MKSKPFPCIVLFNCEQFLKETLQALTVLKTTIYNRFSFVMLKEISNIETIVNDHVVVCFRSVQKWPQTGNFKQWLNMHGSLSKRIHLGAAIQYNKTQQSYLCICALCL